MDNKRTYALIAAGILLVLAMGLYVGLAKDKVLEKKEEKQVTADEKKFKKEYESLNGVVGEGRENAYVDTKIPAQNKMIYASKEEILSLLEKGTGIIYFGFPECPWCRNALPILIEAAKEESVSKIYYYNAKEDRDEKIIKDGKISTEKEGTDFYKKVLENLGDKASFYDGLDDKSIKRLYFPTIVFVKEGEILSIHESTVESQEDASIPLTKKQRTELKDIYVKGMTSVYGSVCDDKC